VRNPDDGRLPLTAAAVIRILVTLAAAASLAGCATASAFPIGGVTTFGPPLEPPIPVGSIPTSTGPDQLGPLPITVYVLDPAQYARLTEATAILVHSCMTSFGFDYSLSTSTGPTDQADGDLPDSDPKAAAVDGYRNRAVVPPPAVPSPSRPEQLVLTGGTARPVNGSRVPPGGCLGAARRTIAGGADPATVFGDAALVSDIRLNGYVGTLSDSRVGTVFGEWSECMAAKGFHYVSPVAAATDPRWNVRYPPTALEISTATTDVACKYRYNVNGVVHAVQVAFQTVAIQANAPALRRLEAGRDAALRVAARIIAGDH
jgi:hypothetical protein